MYSNSTSKEIVALRALQEEEACITAKLNSNRDQQDEIKSVLIKRKYGVEVGSIVIRKSDMARFKVSFVCLFNLDAHKPVVNGWPLDSKGDTETRNEVCLGSYWELDKERSNSTVGNVRWISRICNLIHKAAQQLTSHIKKVLQ